MDPLTTAILNVVAPANKAPEKPKKRGNTIAPELLQTDPRAVARERERELALLRQDPATKTTNDPIAILQRRRSKYGFTPALQDRVRTSPEVLPLLETAKPRLKELHNRNFKLWQTEQAIGINARQTFREHQAEVLAQIQRGNVNAPTYTWEQWQAQCDIKRQLVKGEIRTATPEIWDLCRPIVEAGVVACERLARADLKAWRELSGDESAPESTLALLEQRENWQRLLSSGLDTINTGISRVDGMLSIIKLD